MDPEPVRAAAVASEGLEPDPGRYWAGAECLVGVQIDRAYAGPPAQSMPNDARGAVRPVGKRHRVLAQEAPIDAKRHIAYRYGRGNPSCHRCRQVQQASRRSGLVPPLWGSTEASVVLRSWYLQAVPMINTFIITPYGLGQFHISGVFRQPRGRRQRQRGEHAPGVAAPAEGSSGEAEDQRERDHHEPGPRRVDGEVGGLPPLQRVEGRA